MPQASFFVLLWFFCGFVYLAYDVAQGQHQHSCRQITNGVGYVEGYARYNPSHSLLKAQTKHNGLCRCVQYPKSKSVQTADYRVHHRLYRSGHGAWQKYGYAPQYRPYIQIGHPPHIKACVDSVQKHVDINGYKPLNSIAQGGDHSKHPKQVDVGERLHKYLGAEHKGAKHGKNNYFVDSKPFFSSLCKQAHNARRLLSRRRQRPSSSSRRFCRTPNSFDPHQSLR